MNDALHDIGEKLLVLRAQLGDGTAFAELVEGYGGRIAAYLHKLLGDRHLCEDVAQDVWFDVFRSLPRLSDTGAFRPWLYRIARDRAFRQLRKRAIRPLPLDHAENVPEELDSWSLDQDELGRLHVAFMQLSMEHREVIALRFLENLSYDDIGSIIGCPVGTVRSRLYYAKRQLRTVVQGEFQ